MSCQLFRDLHRGPGLLFLPNAWDAVSARLIESLGAKAIATTSAGLAWACGYPDGNALPQLHLLAAVRDIARIVRVPVTVDIESGYSEDPAAVALLVERLVAIGIVGINIEDGANSPDLLYRKIATIREYLERSGNDLFINARTDVCLRGIAQGEAAWEEIIRRAARYRTAGANGVFVPGLATADGMAAISAAIEPMPLNVMALPNLPSIDAMQKSGVRRLSAGSSIAQAAIGRTGELVSNFLAGEIAKGFEKAADYGAVNRLFADSAIAIKGGAIERREKNR